MSRTYCHTHSAYDCQTCADEILSLGIQVDKDRIAALESEVARLEACAAQAEPEEKIDFEKLESLGWQIAICAMCGTHAAAIKPAQSVPVEVFDSHCNYASFAGRVCNKCGRIHDGGLGGMVGGEQVSKAEEKAAEADELRKDAERYRWIRDPKSPADKVILFDRGAKGKGVFAFIALDECIDAAIAQEPKK